MGSHSRGVGIIWAFVAAALLVLGAPAAEAGRGGHRSRHRGIGLQRTKPVHRQHAGQGRSAGRGAVPDRAAPRAARITHGHAK